MTNTDARAYGIGHLTNVRMGPEIVEYLERIDDTLAPYGGRFIVHGNANATVHEGVWQGDLIIIEFPDRDSAQNWYNSPAYQAILPLRVDHADSVVMILDGVSSDHVATDVLRSSQVTLPAG